MPDGAILVRAATLADAGQIARVHSESWRTTYAGILPPALIEREAGAKSEGLWQRNLSQRGPGATTLVAEMPGHGIVGFASCGETRGEVKGFEAEIYALYVLQAHQRRGVGRELVRESARHFVRNALFAFYLWVLRANRARLFYEALGGEEVAQRTENLGGHEYGEVAYGWRDLTELVTGDE